MEEPEASRSVLTPVPGISWGLTLAAVSSQSEQEKRTDVHNPGMWALQNHRKAQSPGKSGAVLRAPGPAADPSPMMPAPCSWAVSSQERPAEGPPRSFPGSTVQRGWAGHLGGALLLSAQSHQPQRGPSGKHAL